MSTNILQRLWARNALIIFFLTIFFVLGLWTGKAFASDRPQGRVIVPKTKRVSFTLEDERKIRGPIKAANPVARVEVQVAASPAVHTEPKIVVDPIVSYDEGSIEAMIAEVFPENPQLWIRIARCESGLRPDAHNSSGASGIFQMMMPMHAKLVGGDPFDPVLNIRAARSLSREGTSTGAWDASRSCWS